ncbi:unnamed protein product, partial [marine sediment metagenome]
MYKNFYEKLVKSYRIIELTKPYSVIFSNILA